MTTRDTHREGEEISKAPSEMAAEELQTAKVTLGGASHAVTFLGLGLEPMLDTNYRVVISGETAAKVDESTITTAGFTIISGSSSDVAHVWVHGKIASR